MLEITIGIAIFVAVAAVLAIPQLRGAALSALGLLAIISVGSALFAVVVWAIYASKPWLIQGGPVVVQEDQALEKKRPEDEGAETGEAVGVDPAARLTEEEQRLLDEYRRRDEERMRLAGLAGQARVILAQDQKLAAQAASYTLLKDGGSGLGDIVAVRIPAWRDEDVAAIQKASIRTWLQSLGLTVDETATIATAKAWGSLYDLWISETSGLATPSPQQGLRASPPVGTVGPPQPELPASPPGAESLPASTPAPVVEIQEESVPVVRLSPPPPLTPRSIPPRQDGVRQAPPRQREPQDSPPKRWWRPWSGPEQEPDQGAEREIGPFGY